MKVQSDFHSTIELDCLSKTLLTVKTEISILLFLPTFELFYNNSLLRKITPEMNTQTIHCVLFYPPQYRLDDSIDDIWSTLSHEAHPIDIKRLKLLDIRTRLKLISRLLPRQSLTVIRAIGWEYIFRSLSMFPKNVKYVMHLAETRLHAHDSASMFQWFLNFTFDYIIRGFFGDEKIDISSNRSLLELCSLMIKRRIISDIAVNEFCKNIAEKINLIFENNVMPHLEYINNLTQKPLIATTTVINFFYLLDYFEDIIGQSILRYCDINIEDYLTSFFTTPKIIRTMIKMHTATNCLQLFFKSTLIDIWYDFLQLSLVFIRDYKLDIQLYESSADIQYIIDKTIENVGLLPLLRYTVLRKYGCLLSFNAKVAILKYDTDEIIHQSIQIDVDRQNILESAKILLDQNNKFPSLDVTFIGEQGYGDGVTREFITLVIKEIVNPDYGIFELYDSGLYYPVPSVFQEASNASWSYLLGIALYYCVLLNMSSPVGFPTIFYGQLHPHFSGIVFRSDLKELDPLLEIGYGNLLKLKEEDSDSLELEWQVTSTYGPFTKVSSITPPSHQQNNLVAHQDVFTYVYKSIEHKLLKQVSPCISRIRASLLAVYSHLEILREFNACDMQKLIQGNTVLDYKAWEAATEVSNFEHNPEIIDWFWKIVSHMSNTERKELYQFMTGMSTMPVYKLGYRIVGINRKCMPSSNTCFLQLKLWNQYKCMKDLVEDIYSALQHTNFLLVIVYLTLLGYLMINFNKKDEKYFMKFWLLTFIFIFSSLVIFEDGEIARHRYPFDYLCFLIFLKKVRDYMVSKKIAFYS